MSPENIDIHTADGLTLRGTLYRADRGPALLIASALGVKRRYYDAFARAAAERGMNVVTFDYRGIGDSAPPRIRDSRASMVEWGRFDVDAMIAWIAANVAEDVAYLGHSAGAQLTGLAPNAHRIRSAFFLTAGSGYWRHWSGIRGLGLGALWIAMPLISRTLGYFPSKVLGLGSEDLPAGVAAQWATWGKHRDYLFSTITDEERARYHAFTAPILAWSMEGDHYAPRRAVDALLRFYPNAPITREHIEDRTIGHFGFFRRNIGEHL
ncbi:MAG TPA: alpha/beta fold hydrolase, partial [Thermoanaerobaculia bacterium]|nr:alpha/beta fold hydrolase [Thermoanaerobaculia bacterium]